uniref:Squamosa-promoter binding protein-like protein n=1 Tax=Bambusa multiplex TaxID=4582 RepID=A0A3Q8AS22_BAMML|nr:squamosa-promoter binding protein-like protein [Bambusa multiplex]
MQREVGPQVAPPLFMHQIQQLPPYAAAAKKRGHPWTAGAAVAPSAKTAAEAGGGGGGNWNPRMWDWDSRALTAKPSSDAIRFGGGQSQQQQPAAAKAAEALRQGGGGSGGLSLQLGLREEAAMVMDVSPEATGASSPSPPASAGQEPVVRPSKRVRSGSPGSAGGGGGGGGSGNGGGSYPMCQVDDCRADLTNAKDYHRRHKVCEIHSKTTKSLVASQMQRFCQQCSRFHPLSEFDEGKRSCRRRLAGHNRRRRKTHPTDVASQLLLPGNQENAANRTQDIVNLITVIAHLQGSNVGKLPSVPAIPDKDNLVQIISKINSMNNANSVAKSPSEVVDLNASHGQQQDSVQKVTNGIDKQTVPTMDLLAVLSTALAASTPETNTSQSQGSSDSSGNNKSKSHSTEPASVVNSHEKSIRVFPAAGMIRSNNTQEGPPEIYKQSDGEPYLSLQLFGSTEEDIPPKMDTANKYLSSESSNPLDERSPSSSPPITHKFFPIRSVAKDIRHPHIADYGEDVGTVEVSTSRAWCAPPLELFKDSERPIENGSPPNPTYQTCYASTSCSDHSPSTSNSDGQDRTGRIIFKLFGKEPGTIPGNLRDEIVNWLKHSPTEMEGYIRPGCLVLSMYLSMPAIAWDELEENLLQRVNTLVQGSDLDFWRKGRFLVRTDTQLVSYKDGMTRVSKSWRTWNTPELTIVSPIAVVGGRKTSLVLKGRNLTIPGTQIHCTSTGKYISKEVLCSAYPGTIYDDSGVETFDLPGEPHLTIGRCFIEVDNRFRGNSFPVIIANSSICQELRNLEAELEDSQFLDVSTDDQVHDARRLNPRDHVLHFLNELGWLFQKSAACTPCTKSDISDSDLIQFSTARFKYLLLFSNERDWCSLTKTLLDILAKRSLVSDELSQETLEMLSEIHLLNRAVKRKSSRMVHLLVQFVVICPDNSRLYPFLPNLPGPGGLTPLHLAASIDEAEDIVDALTDDPQLIGLSCWQSVLDDDGQSPETYAKLRNNHWYNELVAQKLVDRKNSQLTIMVNKEEIRVDAGNVGENNTSGIQALQIRSCSQCAILESGRLLRRPLHSRGLLARPYIHSMLAIAAVCVCVCVFMRALLRFNSGKSFKWERLDFGTI